MRYVLTQVSLMKYLIYAGCDMYIHAYMWLATGMIVAKYFKLGDRFIGNAVFESIEYPKQLVWC